jgi:hypothetical protein
MHIELRGLEASTSCQPRTVIIASCQHLVNYSNKKNSSTWLLRVIAPHSPVPYLMTWMTCENGVGTTHAGCLGFPSAMASITKNVAERPKTAAS